MYVLISGKHVKKGAPGLTLYITGAIHTVGTTSMWLRDNSDSFHDIATFKVSQYKQK